MTRYVILGAGAIGAVVGAKLFGSGAEVVLIARGEQYQAISSRGLLLCEPSSETIVGIPVVAAASDVPWRSGDVVLIAVKGQQTVAALDQLATTAPLSTVVVAMQNGVHSEGEIARRFPRTYGACVACPTSYLEPGAVAAYSSPLVGLIDFGRYATGTDEVTADLATAFRRAGFDSRELDDVMFWKWRKLFLNLTNALEVVCGPGTRGGQVASRLQAEARDCLAAAGIAMASEQDDRDRRGRLLQLGEVRGRPRPGASTWQSVARGERSVETAYLNGEITRIGRRRGVATPVNSLVVRMSEIVADTPAAPAVREGELLSLAAAVSWSTGRPTGIKPDDIRPEIAAFWGPRLLG